MSYIYEALKRAEDEHEQRAVTPRTPGRPAFFAVGPRWWLWALIAILGANALLLVVLIVARPSRSPEMAAPARPNAGTAAVPTAPARGGDVVPVLPPGPLPVPVAPPVALPPAAPVAATRPAVSAPAKPVVPAAPAIPPASVSPAAPAVSLPTPSATPVEPPRTAADMASVATPSPPAVAAAPPAVSAPPPVPGAPAAPAIAPAGPPVSHVTPPTAAPAPPVSPIVRPAPAVPLAPSATRPMPAPPVETLSRASTPGTRAGDGESAIDLHGGPEMAPKPPMLGRAPAEPGRVSTAVEAPKLRVQVVVYSDVPAERLVFIDGRRYAEGASVDAETVVERITPEGAVVVRRGQRFVLVTGRP